MNKIEISNIFLQNIQGLIRAMDVKGGIVITISGILAAAMQGITIYFFDKCYPANYEKKVIIGLVVIFLITIGYVLYHAILTVLPRSAETKNKTSTSSFIYPSLILKKHKTAEEYFKNIKSVGEDGLLENYSEQIIQCSRIYERKHSHVNRSLKGMVALLFEWVIYTILVLGFTSI